MFFYLKMQNSMENTDSKIELMAYYDSAFYK